MSTDLSSTSSASRALREAILPGPDTPVVFDYVRVKGPEGIKCDVWYCNTHIPALAGEYSVRRMRRYAAPSRASYLAVGEIADIRDHDGEQGTNSSPGAVLSLVEHHERFVGEPLGIQRRRDVGE